MTARAAASFRALLRAGTAAALCLLAAAPQEAQAQPRRIVSLNVCSDQLLLLLADPSRIASLSFLAAEPASSAMAAQAKGFHLNRGRAEEILPLEPDLVLAGAYGARSTVALLRRLGYPVVEMPLATSLSDVAAHIRMVATVVGEGAKGERLIANFGARLKAIPKPPPGPRPVAVLFEPNGITSGQGTLADAVMAAAGFDNLARRLGVSGVGQVPLEAVVAARPDALILGRLAAEHPSLATASLAHPALAQAASGAVANLPHHLWACPIPAVADAVAALALLRKGITPGGPPS